MPVKKPALGRGLEALFSDPSPALESGPPTRLESLRQVAISEIRPNPFQPRTSFDGDKLDELVASVRAKGILQPVVLRRHGTGFQLVAGERRWRAAQKAGLEEIPAVIREYADQEMMEAALIENLQRDDLNPLDEAQAYQRLIQQFNLTQEDVAEAVGKSRVAVTNALRLLKLPREVHELLSHDRLSAGHARALLALDSPGKQVKLARQIVEKGLSVREVERQARRGNSHAAIAAPQLPGPIRDDVTEIQERMTTSLQLKVRILPKSNTSGKIEINYTSLDEFQRLCEQLGVPNYHEL